ncbi:MAG: tetratricopeptide (TPR) repeat protein, partial [Myxococcota bacterium]
WRRVIGQAQAAGDLGLARTLADAAIEALPAEATPYVARGRVRLATGDQAGAHEDHVAALTRSSNLRDTLKEVDQTYRNSGLTTRLQDVRARVVSLRPGHSEHLLALGQSMLDAGRPSESRQVFQRYLVANPRGQLAVAETFREAGLFADALRHYERAFEPLNEDESRAALLAAAALLESRGEAFRMDAFVERYLIGGAQRGGASLSVVADAYVLVGRPDDALTWLEREEREDPAVEIPLRIARLRSAIGDADNARTAFERYLSLQSSARQRGRSHDLFRRATREVVNHYLARGDVGGARVTIDHAERVYGPKLRSPELAARVRVHQREPGQALGQLVDLSKGLDPTTRAARHTLVVELVGHGYLDEAIEATEIMLRAGWDDQLGLARVRLLARRGRGDAGVEAARTTRLERGRRWVGALGAVLVQEGEVAAGRAYLKTALVTPGTDAAELGLALGELARTAPEGVGGAEEPVLGALDPMRRRRAQVVAGLRQGNYTQAFDDAVWVLARSPVDHTMGEHALHALAQLQGEPTAGAVGWEARLETLMTLLEGRTGDRLTLYGRTVEALRTRDAPRLALAVLERWIAVAASDGRLRLKGLSLAYEGGDIETARRYGEGYLGVVGDTVRARLTLAEASARWFRPKQARLHLAAISTDTQSHEVVRRMMLEGQLALLEGDLEGAKAAFERALSTSSEETHTRIIAAEMALALPDGAELASTLLGPVVGDDGAPFDALLLEATARWRLNNAPAGRAAWSRMRRRYPTQPAFDAALLQAVVGAGSGPALAELIRAARVRDGVSAAALAEAVLDALSDGSASSSQRKATAPLVRRLVAEASAQNRPSSPRVARLWGRLAVLIGNPTEATQALEAAWSRRPDSATNAALLALHLAKTAQAESPEGLAQAERVSALAMTLGAEPRATVPSLPVKRAGRAPAVPHGDPRTSAYSIARATALVARSAVQQRKAAIAPATQSVSEAIRLLDSEQPERLVLRYALGRLGVATGDTIAARAAFTLCAQREWVQHRPGPCGRALRTAPLL